MTQLQCPRSGDPIRPRRSNSLSPEHGRLRLHCRHGRFQYGGKEEWLLQCGPAGAPASSGAVSAMARAIFDEWRLAHSLDEFKHWLDRGAPSADADEGKRQHRRTDQGERQ